MKKIKILASAIFLATIISCNLENRSNHQQIEKEEGKIISLLIDEMVMAFPIPPPPPKDGSKPKPINIDSIKKVKVKIVVDTTMVKIEREIKIPKEYKDFNNVIDDIKELSEKSIEKSFLKSERVIA